jgi:hypothetical protein
VCSGSPRTSAAAVALSLPLVAATAAVPCAAVAADNICCRKALLASAAASGQAAATAATNVPNLSEGAACCSANRPLTACKSNFAPLLLLSLLLLEVVVRPTVLMSTATAAASVGGDVLLLGVSSCSSRSRSDVRLRSCRVSLLAVVAEAVRALSSARIIVPSQGVQ